MNIKKIWQSALNGLAIGSLLSIIFSLLYSPNYWPVNPLSTLGAYYYQHFHPAQVMLFAALIWMAIGALFGLGGQIFAKDWSLLRMSLTHYATMLLGILPLAILAGWFPLAFLPVLSFVLSFSLVYLFIYAMNYFFIRKNIEAINRQLKQ